MKKNHHIIVRFQIQNEAELAKLFSLIKANIELSKTSPAFVEATFLKNAEGTTLINHAVWTSFEDYSAFWNEKVMPSEANRQILAFHPQVDHLTPVG